MHLVFATSIVPNGTPTTGYDIANHAIVDGLRRAGVKVTVLGFSWPGSKPADPVNTRLLGSVDVRTDNASAGQKVEWLWSSLRRGLPVSSVKLRVSTPQDVERALASIEPFDGIVINATQMGGAFERVLTARPYIYVAHNVEHVSAEQNADASPGLARRLMFRREARLLEALERRLCRGARFVWTLADEDRGLLGVDDARSAALPLSTPAALVPAGARPALSCDAALIGTWTWTPNRIGLDWFLSQVVPHLPSDFRIRIAGMTPGNLDVPARGVELAGRVPDAIDFMRSAAVVPLVSRAGTGVQLKTIETFELGLPSVATSHSLRGVAHRPSNCVVADQPRIFAEALVRMACERPKPLDGSAFIMSQRAALDAAIARGLAGLGPVGNRLAA